MIVRSSLCNAYVKPVYSRCISDFCMVVSSFADRFVLVGISDRLTLAFSFRGEGTLQRGKVSCHFEKVMYIEKMGLFRCYPYMAEYLARIFSKYSYTVLTALESCFAISG